jgi:hypothetical protein
LSKEAVAAGGAMKRPPDVAASFSMMNPPESSPLSASM